MKRKIEPVRTSFPLQLSSAPSAGALRVAVDLSHVRPGGENGGVKPFIFEYLRELGRREGTEMTVLFLTWSVSHHEVRTRLARPQDLLICVRQHEGADLEALVDWRAGEWTALPTPADLLLQLKADVLYAPLGSAEFACPGIPVIATVVDLLHRDYPYTLTPHDIRAREGYFADLVARVDRFQCISNYTADRLRLHYGVSADRLFCTHIVVQHRLDVPHGTSPVPSGRPYFLFPANAWEHKNHLTLLVAYRNYWQAAGASAWNLVLTGHDSARMRSILATAQTLGVADHVLFYGHLPDADFAALWRGASALVFPSLHEGFGIPLLEAMHFGVPVLCSTEGSLPEVGGDAVLYANAHDPLDWGQSMLRLAQDQSLRENLATRGRERLAEFQIANEVEEFAVQLRSLARQPGTMWRLGVHPDGWMETQALFGLPRAPDVGHARIRVRIAPLPAERRLRAYHGLCPLGGGSVAAGVATEFEFALLDHPHPFVLECPNAGNLNAADHRSHGVILASLELHAGGQIFQLI